MIFQLDEAEIWFPNPELAEEDGLLAIGGDLSLDRLILVYQNGIFPWYSDDTPILWYAPHERFVLFPDELKISKSMRKIMKSNAFNVTQDTAFEQVIKACSKVERLGQNVTWITTEMINAYANLHLNKIAQSVEVWSGSTLVGGLYGVNVNRIFCGESMFSTVSNASKVALITLCNQKKYTLIDCQIYSDHLASLGARIISQQEYLKLLNE